MTPHQLYTTARHYSRHILSPDVEDMVQDAVLAAWRETQTRAQTTPGFLRRRIWMALREAIKKYTRQAQTTCGSEDITEMVTLPGLLSHEDQFLSLPLRGEDRRLAEDMVYCRFERDAVAALGWNYNSLGYKWKDVKVKLRRRLRE